MQKPQTTTRRKQPKRKLSLWARISAFFMRIWWKITGSAKALSLDDKTSPLRTEAEEAVARVILETDIAPDCIEACIVRGGTALKIKHDDAWEVFIHKNYTQAADKAIEWLNLQGDEISTSETSNMNRAQRRAFNANRRHARKAESRKDKAN